MAFDPNSQLGQALKIVSIVDLAAKLGMKPLRVGVQKSPFREDKKGASFSVYEGGFKFKDHACPEHGGNGYNFVKLACPEMSNSEAAEVVIQAAGLDPKAGKKPSKTEIKNIQKKLQVEMYADRRREVSKRMAIDPAAPWPDEVRAVWKEGWQVLKNSPERQRKIAKSRGWPVSVVTRLVDLGLIATPWLPWAVPGHDKAKRGVAFRVDQPEAENGSGGARLKMQPIGYHQRYWRDGRKPWAYVPYLPSAPFSPFQQELVELNCQTLPLPFVLGNLSQPTGVAILEGQWDATTLYHACKGFDAPTDQPGIVVFGMRGTRSIEPFISFYGQWLRRHKPTVLLMGDADTAGRAWANPHRKNLAELPPVSFVDRLNGQGCTRVVTQFLKPSKGLGKDYNDYWKIRRPEPEAVLQWFENLGIPCR